MRTTINIEPDVLAAAKAIARQQQVGVGKVISKLVREALAGQACIQAAANERETRTGFLPFPARPVSITNELIDRLRDEGAD